MRARSRHSAASAYALGSGSRRASASSSSYATHAPIPSAIASGSGSPDIDIALWAPSLLNTIMAPAIDAARHAALFFYQPNPLLPNPLRGVLTGLLDPSAFGREDAPLLVVSATSVRTGEVRMFVDDEVTADALLASGCLPHVFPAVEIDGDVAMVWAPFVVRVGGKVSNCGFDHFDLVRDKGVWKVMNLTFSSRIQGCPAE